MRRALYVDYDPKKAKLASLAEWNKMKQNDVSYIYKLYKLELMKNNILIVYLKLQIYGQKL